MITRFELGQQVEMLPLGLCAIVHEVLNGGELARVKATTGAVFTVMLEECKEPRMPMDPHEALFCATLPQENEAERVLFARGPR